ncbi:MAG: hypothetical protein HYS12_04365 [Planctomycetes bacterium]|nr:hypothetical protein [Planctomycetota bacterium]
MTPTTITVEATLQPDGVTLHLDKKLALPPGRVRVVVQPVPEAAPPQEDWWQLMQRLRREREEAGHPFLSEEEMNAHLAWLREGDAIDDLLRLADEQRQRQERPGC